MSYIYDPELVELMGCKCDAAIARDDKGRRLATPHKQTGKWLNVAIPHKGWTCVRVHRHVVNIHDADDAGAFYCDGCGKCTTAAMEGKPRPVEWTEASRTCEMCELAEIMWVHTMFHPDYPEKLACGKVCAGILQNNMEAAQQFEKLAKAIERARKRHADGLRTLAETIKGAKRSDWDEDDWVSDVEWPKDLRIAAHNGTKARSVMFLEIGGYWLAVSRRGKGYRGFIGDMRRGERSRSYTGTKKVFSTVSEAQAWAVNRMAGLWRTRLDKSLAAVLSRSKATNDLGDEISFDRASEVALNKGDAPSPQLTREAPP